MTITQTVDIPANSRKLMIDIPSEIPAGKAQLEWKIIPFPTKDEPLKERRGFGCAKGQFKMADDFDDPFEEQRGYGCMKGKIRMADDFDAPLEDFKDYM